MRPATLALDIATRTGYAWTDGRNIKTGVWNLGRGNTGGTRSPVRPARLWRRLTEFCIRRPVQRIIYEETFARGNAKFLLDGMQWAVLLYAYDHGLDWARVAPSRLKKAATGNGRASKADMVRTAQQRYPEQRLWTEDQCDALLLLDMWEANDD